MIAEAYGLPGLTARATTLTILFNGALKKQMQRLSDGSDIEIERFDLFKLFSRIVEKGDKLGFTNTTEACFLSELGTFNPACSFGFNFDQFIYFDEIHPTARVHELVGIALSRKVQDDDRDEHRKHGKHDRDDYEEEKEVESATD